MAKNVVKINEGLSKYVVSEVNLLAYKSSVASSDYSFLFSGCEEKVLEQQTNEGQSASSAEVCTVEGPRCLTAHLLSILQRIVAANLHFIPDQPLEMDSCFKDYVYMQRNRIFTLFFL